MIPMTCSFEEFKSMDTRKCMPGLGDLGEKNKCMTGGPYIYSLYHCNLEYVPVHIC